MTDQLKSPDDDVRIWCEDGTIYIDTPSDGIAISERAARWLAITALPAILPAVPSPKTALDERLNRG